MRDGHRHCEALVRESDKDRYLSSLFLPAEIRPHAFAILAFNLEIARVRERAVEPLAGEVRLQWWRDVFADNAAGAVEANPVAAALLATMKQYKLPAAPFERLIEAREFDLYDDAMPSTAAFEAYVRLTTSSLFEQIGRLLMGESTAFATAAGHAGLAYGITGLLRALPLHASRGQIYLPGDVLARHHVDPESVLGGRTTQALLDALADLREIARRHYAELDRLIPALPAKAQPAFLPLVLTDAYLGQMERKDYDPFANAIELSPMRRQWKLWRAARRAP
jgi:15-cis-phytoene synthase